MGKCGGKVRFWVLHQAVREFNLLTDQKASIAVFLGHKICSVLHLALRDIQQILLLMCWREETKWSCVWKRNMRYSSHNRLQYWACDLADEAGRCIGQAVRRRPLTANIPVRSQTSPLETCAEDRVSVPAMAVPCHCHATSTAPPTFLHL